MTAATASRRYDVDIIVDDGDWNVLGGIEPAIHAAVAAVAAHLPSTETGDICIALSSDAAVARLNAQFRGIAKPTNVLSFPSSGGDRLGDIVLALETVLKEAQDQAIKPSHHVQHLAIHGVLHLLGYDHVTDADADRMEAIEIAILAKLGIENPYTEPLRTDKIGDAR